MRVVRVALECGDVLVWCIRVGPVGVPEGVIIVVDGVLRGANQCVVSSCGCDKRGVC